MSRVIEIIEGEHGLTVIDQSTGLFANSLGADEALFVVAQLLTGSTLQPRYSKTYEGHDAWERRYHPAPKPVALLEDLRARQPVVVARRMGRVYRSFDELGQLVNRFIRLKGHP